MYEILGRKLSAYNNTKGIVNSFLHKIVVIYGYVTEIKLEVGGDAAV